MLAIFAPRNIRNTRLVTGEGVLETSRLGIPQLDGRIIR